MRNWLRNYALAHDRKGFVVGVSGGVDSAVASSVAASTGLPLLCLALPIHQAEAEHQRGVDHCAALAKTHPHTCYLTLDLTADFDAFLATMGKVEGNDHTRELAEVNTKSRLRLAALYYHATANDALVIGTGNRVEQRGVGFFAKYGDGGMDIAPLAGLTKSEVYRLAEHLQVDPRIIQAPPTDGLWPDGRTDMDQIGATYVELEWAMDLREGGVDTQAMVLSKRQLEVLQIYDERHGDNRHKREDPPVGPIPFSMLKQGPNG